MPVYNGASFLADAIRSILNQTFADFEFLIIDDGSTDGGVEIVEQFHDARIRLVHNGTNQGLVASLNRGLELARGEYVARMDADDISRPERLERQVRFMASNLRVGVCGSWVRFFPGGRNDIWKLPEKSEEIRCWQFHSVGVAHPAVMLRRSLFRENGLRYDPHYRHIEDYELWGRALPHMDFANIQEVLLEYRTSPGQICRAYGAEQQRTVAPLRLQRVRELGLDPSPVEQELHEMVMNGTLPPDSAHLDCAEQWLLQLGSANRDTRMYSPELFSRRMLDIWFSTCIRLSAASSCSLRRCMRSSLWDAAELPAWHRLRAAGAWTLQKGGR
jgi:hypothetical protein